MLPQEEKEFVKQVFQKLKERGWFSGKEYEQLEGIKPTYEWYQDTLK